MIKRGKIKQRTKRLNLLIFIILGVIILAVVLIAIKMGKETTGKVASEEKESGWGYEELSKQNITRPKFQGYIVQFKDKSVIEKKVELEKSKIKIKITQELKKHRTILENNHKTIKSKILQKLGKEDLKILNEYYNVFNGIALNITTEEARKLKELPEIKEVYPNLEVHTTLMDSVPLINADDVWQLNADGNSCMICPEGTTLSGDTCISDLFDFRVFDANFNCYDSTQSEAGNDGCWGEAKYYCENDFRPGESGWSLCGKENQDFEDYLCNLAHQSLNNYQGVWTNDEHENTIQANVAESSSTNGNVECGLNQYWSKTWVIAEGVCCKPLSKISEESCLTGKGVTIAIIDTGVDYTHPDLGGCTSQEFLSGNCEKVIGGWNFVNNNNNPMDDHGHGTHVAGIAAGNTYNLSFSKSDFNISMNFRDGSNISRFFLILKDDHCPTPPISDWEFTCVGISEISIIEDNEEKIKIKLNVSNIMDNDIDFDLINQGNYYFLTEDNKVSSILEFLNITLPEGILSPNQNANIYLEFKKVVVKEFKGVAPDATLYAFKVLSSSGGGSSDNVIAAIEKSYDLDNDGYVYGIDLEETDPDDIVDIISMSLGGLGNPNDAMSQAVDNAVGNGTIAVIAAGNSGPLFFTFGAPGNARESISVGATYKKNYSVTYGPDINPRVDQIAYFSSRGPTQIGSMKPEVVAPGVFICAARYDKIFPYGEHPYYYPCEDEKHVLMAGTSMATPIVSGIVALIKQAHPNWTPEEIKMALKNSAKSLNEDIRKQGFGRVDVLEAINSPKPPIARIYTEDIWTTEPLVIKGKSTSENFVKYNLYYGTGSDPSEWTKLIESNQQVQDSVLYTFNSIPDNLIFSIKLVVEGNGIESEDQVVFYNSIRKRGGWPFSFSDMMPLAPLVIGDIDNDGNKEIVSVTLSLEYRSKVYVFNHDGSLMGRWPKTIDEITFLHSPVLADLDNNGTKEIISVDYAGKKIYAWHHDGNNVVGWPVSLPEIKILNSPIIGDIDNDGNKEIILSMDLSQLFVLNKDGTIKMQFDVDNAYETGICILQCRDNSLYPLIADLNNDGSKEIIFVSARKLYVWGSNGELLDDFPKNFVDESSNEYAFGNLVIGDIDNDGNKEIIFTSYNIDSKKFKIFVANNEGEIISGWPKEINYLIKDVILGDLDNDNIPEIVVTDCSNIYIFSYDGKVVSKGFGSRGQFADACAYPIIGDINNDGFNEIIESFWADNAIYAFDKNLNIVEDNWPIPYNALPIDSSLTLSDLDNDGKLELILNTFFFDNQIFVYNLIVDKGKLDWPRAHYDEQNTRCYKCDLCKDSDGGKNYQKKGKVELRTGEIYEDSCAGSFYLREYYCDGNQKKITTIACPKLGRDFICKDGACISSIPPTPLLEAEV